MKKLLNGIADFRKRVLPTQRERFAELSKGQNPDVLFITCSDSRVAPNWFASTDPGDLFVVRNVGNLVPPVQSSRRGELDDSPLAAAEFSILRLNVTDVVVCGHSECGAMNALISDAPLNDTPHLKSWLTHGAPALRKFTQGMTVNASLSRVNQLSQINVLQQIEHLKSHPFIQKQIQERKLKVHGWWFDIAKADVYAYQESIGQFKLIE